WLTCESFPCLFIKADIKRFVKHQPTEKTGEVLFLLTRTLKKPTSDVTASDGHHSCKALARLKCRVMGK
ncbi:MAG TPA: hypothetical protein H9698_09120, partial [Candidatus Ruthenibacterium merdavium]|nr:hypothetical protein [Candidatus Ruthenibacterium merdavium]